ncbi:MAG: X-Pro dipeptidyl-peptidase, partial [Saprospiraceae bacterium]|nr:X-Pro dipeptidyl-peptidase [Candidatus Brachybacter algidus]
HLNDIKPAVMVVGGLFDAEDCYGAWNTFKTLESQSSSSDNMLVMGPWYHGNWGGRGDGASIGNVKFGQKTAEWYQNEMEDPVF